MWEIQNANKMRQFKQGVSWYRLPFPQALCPVWAVSPPCGNLQSKHGFLLPDSSQATPSDTSRPCLPLTCCSLSLSSTPLCPSSAASHATSRPLRCHPTTSSQVFLRIVTACVFTCLSFQKFYEGRHPSFQVARRILCVTHTLASGTSSASNINLIFEERRERGRAGTVGGLP